jgi:hypothetical protein
MVVVMVAVNHGVMAHDVMVVTRQALMMVMVYRARRGHAGRQGEGDGRRERQGHEFQGLPPDFQGPNRFRGIRLAWPPHNCRDGKGSPGDTIQA